MGKSSFFTGQPIFNQILRHIPRGLVQRCSRELGADRYCKKYRTYDHLVTMVYAILNRCMSLREVTTGLLAWELRIDHLGLKTHPRRSTLSDANQRRGPEVFERIYHGLLAHYKAVLPDSRKRSRKNNLYIFDATSIALFQEILKGSGLSKQDGRRKGGIKVHTLLHAASDVPTMIRFSPGASNDASFLREVKLPKGSVVVFDKGYRNYASYNRLSEQRVTWVTRHRDSSVYSISEELAVNDYQASQGVQSDQLITLGHDHQKKAIKVKARMVTYLDAESGKSFQFITNNTWLAPMTIANYYRQRWQIETFFKRIKQNYPLQYFLGDNENAIKIQIWCALITDLLLKVIQRGSRSTMSFSNLASLVRLHLMTYMDLKSFLKAPEKSLLRKIRQSRQYHPPNLFNT
jgi:transposase